jgi:two-component system, OmpR family, alkaline phosphatase synthesis response regulator PhoP
MTDNKGKKILVVEDEAPLRTLLVAELKREGINAIGAKDGEEGLELALKEHPHLLLVDILMPKKDGLQMVKELRGDAWGKEAIVVLLTNLNDSEKIVEALQYGTREYLVKADWRIEDVIKMAKEKIGMR